MDTFVAPLATLPGMAKRENTVPIHARLSESDVATVDKAASEQPIPVSRSHMIALIVREWIKNREAKKKR